MKTLLLCFISILLSANAYTQRSFDNYKWILKFAPLALIDPLTPTIQPGIEYKIFNRWSVEADYGLRFRAFRFTGLSEGFQHYRYNKWRIEGRRYFSSNRKLPTHRYPYFIAAEAFLFRQQYGKVNNYYTPRSDTVTYDFDSAGVRRAVSGLYFKIGFQSHFKRDSRFFMEWQFGLGARYIKVNYQDVKNGRITSNRYFREFQVSAGDNFSGTEPTVHFAVNLKLAYNL